jgi:hypothetical protein
VQRLTTYRPKTAVSVIVVVLKMEVYSIIVRLGCGKRYLMKILRGKFLNGVQERSNKMGREWRFKMFWLP